MKRARRPCGKHRNRQRFRYPLRRKKCLMRKMRILMANEPRSYREAFVSVLRTLRPNTEVIEVDPEELDPGIERYRPDLVVCSRITTTLETEAPAWVLLYPEDEPIGMVCTAGDLSTLNNFDLDHLISIVDRVATLMNDGRTPLP